MSYKGPGYFVKSSMNAKRQIWQKVHPDRVRFSSIWFKSFWVCVVLRFVRFGSSLFRSVPIWVCVILFYFEHRHNFGQISIDSIRVYSSSGLILITLCQVRFEYGLDHSVKSFSSSQFYQVYIKIEHRTNNENEKENSDSAIFMLMFTSSSPRSQIEPVIKVLPCIWGEPITCLSW